LFDVCAIAKINCRIDLKTTDAMSPSPEESTSSEQNSSSPVGRGGAGTYIEGELGAYYLLQMLAGT